MSNRGATLGQVISLVFFLMVLISCDEDEGISMNGMYVAILAPLHNAGVSDSTEFVGLLQAEDLLENYAQLHARWISDKDGLLFEKPMDKSGYSRFKTAILSSGIHEITFEVNNGHGKAVRQTITIQNIIHLKATGVGYGNKLEWNFPANVTNFKLYRATTESELKQDLPILTIAGGVQTSFDDTTAFVNSTSYYQIEATVDGRDIHSNIAFGQPVSGVTLDYPLMKIVFDAKRNYVYGIVSPESVYDENQTGYGLVFINTATGMVEKRILENIRFNDLDIDPQGDHLYVSQRSRKIYVIDLDTKDLAETISLDNYIRKLEVGSNNRLYFHVELAANNNYEFRIVDLVTKKELPFKYSGNAGGSFHRGDIDLDISNNTIYFSGPARIKTSFDIFSDMIGNDCCDAAESVIFRGGKVFVEEKLFNKDLVFLGNFLDKNGNEEYIYDCNADGTLAVGRANIFNVRDRSIRKSMSAYYDQALFLNNNRLMLVRNFNPEYLRYRAIVYIYQFSKP